MKSSFNELVSGPKPVLIDFYAEWCGPCKAMAPVLKDLAEDIGDMARIIKIDVDKNSAISQKFQIRGVPTFMIFKNGEVMWRASGMQGKNALLKLLQEHAQTSEEEE